MHALPYLMNMRVALLLLLLLSACDMSTPDSGGDAPIRITMLSAEGTEAPGMFGADLYRTEALHTGLTAHAADGRIVPALASSWRVLDQGRTYIFRLEQASWPDGREITAGDVVAVMRRNLAPASHQPMKPYLMAIQEADAVASNRKPPRMLGVDDPRPGVVVITLDRPDPLLLSLLAHPSMAIVRKEETPPPSGPYAQGRNDGFLVANPYWFDDEEEPRQPISLEVLPVGEAIRAFEEGRTDIVTGGSIQGLRRSRTDALVPALRLEQTLGLYGYLARTSGGPLTDVRIRRALAMVAGRQILVRDYFALDGMQPAFGPLAPTLPEAYAGAVPDWAVWSPEVRMGEARRLVQEAGYGPDRPLTLDVAIPQGDAHEEVLAWLADDWRPLGISLRAYKRSSEQHRRAIESGDYDLALTERIAPAAIPEFFLEPFTCAERLGGYCNPDADSLLAEAAQQVDGAARINLIRRAARLIAEDAPIIPLFSPIRWSLVRPGIAGWEDNLVGAHPAHYLEFQNTQ